MQMKRTFKTEDNRKDNIFAAWLRYSQVLDEKFGVAIGEDHLFEEIFEGLADITELTRETISFKLDNGQKIKDLSIPESITQHLCPKDAIYVCLGKTDNEWWLLDIVSVGSFVNAKKGEFHLTLNPIYIEDPKRMQLQ